MIQIKRALAYFILDEDFRSKVISILITLICIFILIISIVISLPSIVVEGIFGEKEEDLAYVEIYQNSIIELDQLNRDWIEELREKYSYCDETIVHYNYDLTWYELVSIDSVRYKQDFSKVSKEDVLELGESFISRNVEVEEYTVEVRDEEGNTKTETRKRAIITIDTKTLEEIFPEVNIKDEEDILLAENIYSTMLDMNIEGDLYLYDDDIDLSNLKEYPEGSANLPYYNQTDARWGYKSYGSSTIASGGCGLHLWPW